MENQSRVSTTTRLVLDPRKSATPTARKDAAGPMPRDQDGTQRELHLCHELLQAQRAQIKSLQEQLNVARETCQQMSTVNVVVFQRPDDFSIAIVTDGSSDGRERFGQVCREFQTRRTELSRNQTAFAFFEEIPLNIVQDTPFGSTSGLSEMK